MVRLLFLHAIARVSVNSKATAPFSIEQDVQQGCLLALYLLLIIGEILNHCVKRETQQGRIKGIVLPKVEEPQTIAQFVDDTSLFIVAKEAPVKAIHEILQKFCSVSVLYINKGKSSAYYWHPNRPLCPP